MSSTNRFDALTSSAADTEDHQIPTMAFPSPSRNFSWADEKEEEVEAEEAGKVAAEQGKIQVEGFHHFDDDSAAEVEGQDFEATLSAASEPESSLIDSWDIFIKNTPVVFEPSPLIPTTGSPSAGGKSMAKVGSGSNELSIDTGATASTDHSLGVVAQEGTVLRKKKNRTKKQRREAKLRAAGELVEDGAGESGTELRLDHDADADGSRSDSKDEDETYIDAPTERRRNPSGAERRKAKVDAACASKVTREIVTRQEEPAGAADFQVGGHRIPWSVVLALFMVQAIMVGVYLLM